MDIESLYERVREMENDDLMGNTTISKYVTFNMRENIEKIDAYLNSKHITGETDSMGREKPFFNIVTGITNLWYRATDIDRKHIRLGARRTTDVFKTFLMTAHLNRWMREYNFGAFLNEWGRVLVRYGSAVTKFIEKNGELHCNVIPWNRLIIDPVDFENNWKIEILELTPAQLRKNKSYNQEVVESLIESQSTRKISTGQAKDTKARYIKIYEVHGEMPLSYITRQEKDALEYTQQMHVISFVENEDGDGFTDFRLAFGREKQDPYTISHLLREDGRSMGIGAVEHLFEAQWMMNHTVKSIKDQLDLASKLLFQTSDGSFVGQNVLDSLETGDILIHSINQPLTQLNNGSHDITSLQSYGSQWKTLSQEITSTPDALMGANQPSGTAWRQVEALQQEARSLFELFIENKALHLEDMFRKYVFPYLKSKMDSPEEIGVTLDAYGIDQVERMYINTETLRRGNEAKKKAILAGEIPDVDLDKIREEVTGNLQSMGDQRYFKPSDIDSATWKDILSDFGDDVDIEIAGESSFVKDDVATLTTIFQTIVNPNNQNALLNPQVKFLFDQILLKTGTISPVQLKSLPKQPSVGQQNFAEGNINPIGVV